MERRLGLLEQAERRKIKETFLLEYDHIGGEQTQKVKLFLKFQNITPRPYWDIDIRDSADELLGIIAGHIFNGGPVGVEFHAFLSSNLSRVLPEMSHVPFIVRASIAELVHRGLINRWYSAPYKDLTQKGRDLYSLHLMSDPRISVHRPNRDTGNRFLVTARC